MISPSISHILNLSKRQMFAAFIGSKLGKSHIQILPDGEKSGQKLTLSTFHCVQATTQFFPKMSAEFQAKADAVNNLAKKPSDDELLKLYGLFKQATVGDVKTDRPGIFALKDRYKWDSWKEQEGLSQEEAEKKYIELVDELIAKYGTK